MINCKPKLGLKGQVFENGYEVLENRGLAIIWMSVGNSYFKPEVIKELVNFSVENFSTVKVLIPEEPAEYTYQAIGYEPKRAKKKARLNANRLKNHTQRIIEDVLKNKPGFDIEIVDWENQVLTNEKYQKSYQEIKSLYENNEKFKSDARETTKDVLEGKLKDGVDFSEAVENGINYLLEELSFVVASPEIFCTERTVYLYHKEWEIFAKLVNGEYDNTNRKNLGFLLVS